MSCFQRFFFCPEAASLLLHNFCIYHISPPRREMLMNAEKNWLVKSQSAIAKIHGIVITAPATEIYCICENMIRVSVGAQISDPLIPKHQQNSVKVLFNEYICEQRRSGFCSSIDSKLDLVAWTDETTRTEYNCTL